MVFAGGDDPGGGEEFHSGLPWSLPLQADEEGHIEGAIVIDGKEGSELVRRDLAMEAQTAGGEIEFVLCIVDFDDFRGGL